MEEEKLHRRKEKALNGSNRRVLAKACYDLATFYYKHNRYRDAVEEYKAAASIYKELGLQLRLCICYAMIGYTYLEMSEFDNALKYEERYLAMAKEFKDLVKEEHAMAMLGRIYILQGRSAGDDEEMMTSFRAAEKALRKSLELCESLNGTISQHNLMDKRARSLHGIGLVQGYLGSFDISLNYLREAISICSSHNLFEELRCCYINEASLHANKKKDFAEALSCLNKALEVASRLKDKVLATCNTLSSKAKVLCKMSDYQSAKQVLLKAWKLKTPDEKERKSIETDLKVVAAICYTKDLLMSTDSSDHIVLKILYEKLGDGACHMRNFAGAVEYYLKTLKHAELAGDCGKKLIPIYFSLSQTYQDMECYNEALYYYEKEYELKKGVPKAAYKTLCNKAEALYLAKKPYHLIEKACLDARKAAKDWNKRKYEINILKNLLKYQKKYLEYDKVKETEAELGALESANLDNLDNSEDEQSSAGGGIEYSTHIGDDICLDDLTDLSDNNEEAVKGFTIKQNTKGETQLHLACISGNKRRVERLLAEGHPVNVRNNAGWLPLHEACRHCNPEVVNILLNHGADVNDINSYCDGMTPLHVAASKGHLEVVQLLLEKGATPSLKTDFGKTPLDVLQKWRPFNILESRKMEIFYNNICNTLQNYTDKTNIDTLNQSKSETPIKNNTAKEVTPPSTSKMHDRINRRKNRRNIIADDSTDDLGLSQNVRNQVAFPSDVLNSSDECSTKRNHRKDTGAQEFSEVDVNKSKLKPASLNPDEVDDDWLDDDLEINQPSSTQQRANKRPLTLESSPEGQASKKAGRFAGPSVAQVVGPIKVSIQDASRIITAEMATKVEKEILRLVDLENGGGPRFMGFTIQGGVIIITCLNDATRKWLANQVQNLKPWEGASLRLQDEEDLVKPVFVVAHLPNMSVEPDSILRRLHVQNEEVGCDRWSVINSKTDSSGQTYRFELDSLLLPNLQRKNYVLHLGMRMIQFRVEENGTEEEVADESGATGSVETPSGSSGTLSGAPTPTPPLPSNLLQPLVTEGTQETSATCAVVAGRQSAPVQTSNRRGKGRAGSHRQVSRTPWKRSCSRTREG